MLSEYFRKRKGFYRLFQLLRKKYVSLGRFSGTVTLEKITEQEAKDLSDFFGKRIEVGSSFKTSFIMIEKKIKETKYSDFSWNELFSNYFGENVSTKKEINEVFSQEEKKYYQEIMKLVPPITANWLQQVLEERGSIYQNLLKRYNKEKQKLRSDLIWVLKLAGTYQEVVPISLVMLASYSGNPHFLDFGTQNSNLFFKVLSSINHQEEPKTSSDKILFLKNYGIYIDSVSNYVITYKLRSNSQLIESFAKEKEILNLNLSNLEKIEKLDTEEKYVFVFENPSLLLALKKYDVPILITSGIPNYIVYLVLEKLIASDNKIYYNGDFDPEGLIIAAKLKDSFPKIQFFCYDELDYMISKSEEEISQNRLNKLKQIEIPELNHIKKNLLDVKVAGYQEKNQKRIEDFIQNIKLSHKNRKV